MINWDTISALADRLAALFVGLSVVPLALQVRRSLQATRSQTDHLATSALAEMASIVGTEKARSRVFRASMEDPDSLTEDEFTQFGYLGVNLFRRFENVHFQYRSGMIDDDFRIGQRDNILWLFHRPGMPRWWKDRGFAFSKRFWEFLDGSRPEQIESPGSRRPKGGIRMPAGRAPGFGPPVTVGPLALATSALRGGRRETHAHRPDLPAHDGHRPASWRMTAVPLSASGSCT